MAPETRAGRAQTSKIDVWSLVVTMLWVLNASNLRRRVQQPEEPAITDEENILAVTEADEVRTFRETGILVPDRRASAAQMIVRTFEGGGLTTPRFQVPNLS